MVLLHSATLTVKRSDRPTHVPSPWKLGTSPPACIGRAASLQPKIRLEPELHLAPSAFATPEQERSHRRAPEIMSGEAEYWTFPTDPGDFDKDERISFSRLDNKYIAVQDDGTEYEFDAGLRRWIPVIDEDLIQEQQKGYFMAGAGAGADYDNDDAESTPARGGRKRNRSDDREVSCVRMQINTNTTWRAHFVAHPSFPRIARELVSGRGEENVTEQTLNLLLSLWRATG